MAFIQIISCNILHNHIHFYSHRKIYSYRLTSPHIYTFYYYLAKVFNYPISITHFLLFIINLIIFSIHLLFTFYIHGISIFYLSYQIISNSYAYCFYLIILLFYLTSMELTLIEPLSHLFIIILYHDYFLYLTYLITFMLSSIIHSHLHHILSSQISTFKLISMDS